MRAKHGFASQRVSAPARLPLTGVGQAAEGGTCEHLCIDRAQSALKFTEDARVPSGTLPSLCFAAAAVLILERVAR
jgi:hypothetical protein